MLRKIIHATLIVFLTTGAVSAQMPTPGVHLKDDKPSRTKEQKEYDKALIAPTNRPLKRFRKQKRNLIRGAISAPPRQQRRRTSNNEWPLRAAFRRRGPSKNNPADGTARRWCRTTS
jgi:hypothetical protein